MNNKRYTFVKRLSYLALDFDGYVPAYRDLNICEDCGSLVVLRGKHDQWHDKIEGVQTNE